MLARMALRYVVLDFDGTCTQIELVHAGFLADFLAILEDANGAARGALQPAWDAAIARVRAASPDAGWTLLAAPSTAPAAADPYILAGEASALLQRERAIRQVPPDGYARAYAANPAPWRPEVPEVLAGLVARGLRVGFISNSDRLAIEMRLGDLLHANPALRRQIVVHGHAAKFAIGELPVGADAVEPARGDRGTPVRDAAIEHLGEIGTLRLVRRGLADHLRELVDDVLDAGARDVAARLCRADHGSDATGEVAHDPNVAGSLGGACEAEKHGPDQQGDAARGHGRLLERKMAESRSPDIVILHQDHGLARCGAA